MGNATPITSNFTVAPDAYAIVGTCLNLEDQLHARVLQLEAMLSITSGEQGETFRILSDEIQENYLWACGSFIQEIRQLRNVIKAMNETEQSQGAEV